MKDMKNFNYKIEKQYRGNDVYSISFYECHYAKLNDQKLDIPRLLNLSKNEYEKFLKNYNFLYYCDEGWHKYEIAIYGKEEAQKLAEVIESYIVLNKLVEG